MLIYSTAGGDQRSRFRRLQNYIGQPCFYCRVIMVRSNGFLHPNAPSRDHKIPRSRGGTNHPSNLLVCCRRCNEDKSSLDYEEYVAVRSGLASRLDRPRRKAPIIAK